MKRRIIALVAGATAVALAAAAGLAFAHRGPGGPGAGFGGGPGLLHRLLDDPALRESLKLTDDQTTRLKAIAAGARDTLAKQHEGVRAERTALRSLVADPSASRDAIEAQAGKVGKAMDGLRATMTGALLDARDVLTPAQRESLAAEIGRGPGALLHQRLRGRCCAPGAAPPEEPGAESDDGD